MSKQNPDDTIEIANDLNNTSMWINIISWYLNTLCAEGMKKLTGENQNLQSVKDGLDRFTAVAIPSTPIMGLLLKINEYTALHEEDLFQMLFYLIQFCNEAKYCLNSYNIHRLILACCLLVYKMNDDASYVRGSQSNKNFAELGGIETSEMNMLELELLGKKYLDLYITPQRFALWQKTVMAKIGDLQASMDIKYFEFQIGTDAFNAWNAYRNLRELKNNIPISTSNTPLQPSLMIPLYRSSTPLFLIAITPSFNNSTLNVFNPFSNTILTLNVVNPMGNRTLNNLTSNTVPFKNNLTSNVAYSSSKNNSDSNTASLPNSFSSSSALFKNPNQQSSQKPNQHHFYPKQ